MDTEKIKQISLLLVGIVAVSIVILFSIFKFVSFRQDEQYQEEVAELLPAVEANPTVSNNEKNAFLPLTIQRQNITQLALINFEKNPDAVYHGLELQYLKNEDSEGWRVLAYRKDGYIDVYDDETLPIDPEEDFQVAGKGAKEHVNTPMSDLRFEKDERENVHISFAFDDVEGRPIHVAIEEGSDKSSTPFNLLAPIGLGSEQPDYFPLFWLYDFNFIRTKDLRCDISIDGREIEPDPFPVDLPIEGQFRNFIRYTFDSRLYSIFDTQQTTLQEVSLDENNQYSTDEILYQFDSEGGLSHIQADSTWVTFEPALNLTEKQEGALNIVTDDGMGYLKGHYSLEERGPSQVQFKASFDEGWKAHVHLFTHKIFVNDRSVFAAWPKQYDYTLDIDLDTKETEGRWENHRESN